MSYSRQLSILTEGGTDMATKSWHDQCREKRRFWQAHIQAWGKSGLSQKEYCRRQSLNDHQFGYWKRKFASKNDQCGKSRFVSVPVATTPSFFHDGQSDSGLEVHVGDVIIRLSNSFNPVTLSRAVSALGNRS